eukprot:3066577-Rhodomonas_salina.1
MPRSVGTYLFLELEAIHTSRIRLEHPSSYSTLFQRKIQIAGLGCDSADRKECSLTYTPTDKTLSLALFRLPLACSPPPAITRTRSFRALRAQPRLSVTCCAVPSPAGRHADDHDPRIGGQAAVEGRQHPRRAPTRADRGQVPARGPVALLEAGRARHHDAQREGFAPLFHGMPHLRGQGLGFGVLGFWVWGVGFGVSGFGFR